MSGKKIKSAKDITWKFVTNHLNMALISAIGMIPSSHVLGKKYYKDSLSLFDGFVPLFAQVSQSMWQDSISEDPNTLKPCLVTLKKSFISTLTEPTLPAFNKQGEWQMMGLDDDFHDVLAILVPAPIALAFMDKVIFKDKHDEDIFKERISDSMNGLYRTSKVNAGEFDKKLSLTAEQLQNFGLFNTLPVPPKRHYEFANALVAIINHLVILSQTNRTAWQLLSYLKNTHAISEHTPTLTDIGSWLKTNEQQHTWTNTASAFLKILNAIIAQKQNLAFASPKDVVLSTLRELSQGNPQPQSQQFLDDLTAFLRLPSMTTDELLARYSKPLQRAVILFVSRDDVIDLWQKHGIDDKQLLDETDIVLATLLFAVSKGWQALPKTFKEYANLTELSEALLAQISQGRRLDELGHISSKMTTLLGDVWDTNPSSTAKKHQLAFIARQGWDCSFDEIIMKNKVQFDIQGSKLIAKAKSGSTKINHVIDYETFWQNISQLDWINIEMDKQIQKTKIK